MTLPRPIAALPLLVAALFITSIPLPALASECVLLLHGLARSAKTMDSLAEALTEAGYIAVNLDYPSRHYPVEELAQMTIPAGLAVCEEHQTQGVHIVTHSMGGILLRQYLQIQMIPQLRRVVMLGPPNGGSQVVDKLKDSPGFKQMNGPAGLQLGTGEEDLPKRLGPTNLDLGVIAGTRSINWVLSSYLPNPDDGKVSVANTRLEGMCAHLSLPVSHPFLMKNKQVITQTLSFLQHGHFTGELAEQLDCPARRRTSIEEPDKRPRTPQEIHPEQQLQEVSI